MATVSRERVRTALLPVVTTAGFDLEEVAVTAAGRRSLIRVVVDRDGGLDLDAVAEISRIVSEALDATGVTGDAAYTLEVSSPGVDRPLTEPRHWRRAVGRRVRVSTAGLTGRVLEADDEHVVLDVDGVPRELTYPEAGRGAVEVEFS